MFALAQTDANIFEVISGVFSRPDTLAHPKDLVSHLQSLSVVWAMVFLIVGLLVMLNGYKFYKWATVGLALLIGLFAGYQMGKQVNAEYIVGGCLAVLLGVCCFPLMKYAVAAMGGLAGAFIGANAWTALAHIGKGANAAAIADNYWVGALVGLIICGMLAFVLFKLSIILFTSVGGATLAAIGGLGLLLSFQVTSQAVADSVSAHAITIPLLVFVPALIALILQQSAPDTGGAPAAKKPA
jgi:hypothetical protein